MSSNYPGIKLVIVLKLTNKEAWAVYDTVIKHDRYFGNTKEMFSRVFSNVLFYALIKYEILTNQSARRVQSIL